MAQKNYTIVTNQSQLDHAIQRIRDAALVAYDIESTGLNVRKETIIGLAINVERGESYYLPSFRWDKDAEKLQPVLSREQILSALETLKTKKLIMHNASYDTRLTKSYYGVDLLPALHGDTMLAKHTVDEDRPFGLKDIAKQLQSELGLDVESEANEEQLKMKESIKKNGGKTSKNSSEIYKADMELIGLYACADADLTRRIWDYYLPRIEKEGLLSFFMDEEVMPLYREVTIPMEERGMAVNVELLKQAHEDITRDMEEMEDEIVRDLKPYAADLEDKLLKKDYKYGRTGSFAQFAVEYFKLDLPTTPTGAYSLNAKAVEALPDSRGKRFFEGSLELTETEQREIRELAHARRSGKKHVINIASKQHLAYIFFTVLKENPVSFTDKGVPQVNDLTLEVMAEKYEVCAKIRNYNKLAKIKGAYIERFLEEQEDGIFYASYQQHRTISGRYGSDFQQLNRPMDKALLDEGVVNEKVFKYNNMVRQFFIAPQGYDLIVADYESLEPHVFAHMSGDESLRDIFRNGEDLYSKVAIMALRLTQYSADKKADNYLGKHAPEIRQAAKVYALGIPYGMKAWQLGKNLGIETHEAQAIIDSYLSSAPNLRKYMFDCERSVKAEGKIASPFGRVRRMPECVNIYNNHGDQLNYYTYREQLAESYGKREVWAYYKRFKNYLNTAKNFPIQSSAASIVNRAAIAANRAFRAANLDAQVVMQVHDELGVLASEKHSAQASQILQDIMINTNTISVPLKAKPEIGKVYADLK